MFKSTSFNPNGGSSSVPKILSPGTHFCHILDMKLETPPYNTEAYSLNLLVEGEDQGDDFAGLPIDKMNPSLGNYRGQIANIRAGRYPFSTFVYQGREVKRDEQIFRWVNNLAKALGVLDQMNADNVEAETIEEYVGVVKKYVTNPEVWGYFTIGGQEYFTEGYDKPNYRMFLPKSEGKLMPIASANLDERTGEPVNLLKFDRAKHIIQKAEGPAAAESLSGFGGQEPTSTGLGSDLMLP
jgi:hypothetical protein